MATIMNNKGMKSIHKKKTPRNIRLNTEDALYIQQTRSTCQITKTNLAYFIFDPKPETENVYKFTR